MSSGLDSSSDSQVDQAASSHSIHPHPRLPSLKRSGFNHHRWKSSKNVKGHQSKTEEVPGSSTNDDRHHQTSSATTPAAAATGHRKRSKRGQGSLIQPTPKSSTFRGLSLKRSIPSLAATVDLPELPPTPPSSGGKDRSFTSLMRRMKSMPSLSIGKDAQVLGCDSIKPTEAPPPAARKALFPLRRSLKLTTEPESSSEPDNFVLSPQENVSSEVTTNAPLVALGEPEKITFVHRIPLRLDDSDINNSTDTSSDSDIPIIPNGVDALKIEDDCHPASADGINTTIISPQPSYGRRWGFLKGRFLPTEDPCKSAMFTFPRRPVSQCSVDHEEFERPSSPLRSPSGSLFKRVAWLQSDHEPDFEIESNTDANTATGVEPAGRSSPLRRSRSLTRVLGIHHPVGSDGSTTDEPSSGLANKWSFSLERTRSPVQGSSVGSMTRTPLKWSSRPHSTSFSSPSSPVGLPLSAEATDPNSYFAISDSSNPNSPKQFPLSPKRSSLRRSRSSRLATTTTTSSIDPHISMTSFSQPSSPINSTHHLHQYHSQSSADTRGEVGHLATSPSKNENARHAHHRTRMSHPRPKSPSGVMTLQKRRSAPNMRLSAAGYPSLMMAGRPKKSGQWPGANAVPRRGGFVLPPGIVPEDDFLRSLSLQLAKGVMTSGGGSSSGSGGGSGGG